MGAALLACAQPVSVSSESPLLVEAQTRLTCWPDVGPVVDWLRRSFRELPRGAGLTSVQTAFVIFTEEMPGPQGGSWTLMILFPDGSACILGAGERWKWDEDLSGNGEPLGGRAP